MGVVNVTPDSFSDGGHKGDGPAPEEATARRVPEGGNCRSSNVPPSAREGREHRAIAPSETSCQDSPIALAVTCHHADRVAKSAQTLGSDPHIELPLGAPLDQPAVEIDRDSPIPDTSRVLILSRKTVARQGFGPLRTGFPAMPSPGAPAMATSGPV